MPKTAAFVRSLGSMMPAKMSKDQLVRAMGTLQEDLPGDPIGHIHQMVPVSQRCGCGAVHLLVNERGLDEVTRGSLYRLLATPFGDIPREWVRREYGFSNMRFGWDGLQVMAPSFVGVVNRLGVHRTSADTLSDEELDEIVAAIRRDLPGMTNMLETALTTRSIHSVKPEAGESALHDWKALIDQVMFAFSTPLRKFIDEHAMRRHGCRVSAINCCIIMADASDKLAWARRRFEVQTQQQLTPDC